MPAARGEARASSPLPRCDHQSAFPCGSDSSHPTVLGRLFLLLKLTDRSLTTYCSRGSCKASVTATPSSAPLRFTSLWRSATLPARLTPGEAGTAPLCRLPEGGTLTCGSPLPSRLPGLPRSRRPGHQAQDCMVLGAGAEGRNGHPRSWAAGAPLCSPLLDSPGPHGAAGAPAAAGLPQPLTARTLHLAAPSPRSRGGAGARVRRGAGRAGGGEGGRERGARDRSRAEPSREALGRGRQSRAAACVSAPVGAASLG